MNHVSDVLRPLLEEPEHHDPRVAVVLEYLECHLPAYPFNPDLDIPFVQELAEDFPNVDILEQIKCFRWYFDNEPLAHAKKARLKLRRWIAGAVKSREPW